MTAAHDRDLEAIIDRTTTVLLDFDGPICSVFANHKAAAVAASLRSILIADRVSLPARVANENDPLELLRLTSEFAPRLVERVEATLRSLEAVAIRSAEPTPSSREVLLACAARGRTVAVVSNNSQGAVDSYLAAHGLTQHVTLVIGRMAPDPSLLKPSPFMVDRATSMLAADPAACALVGDSVTDIMSARAAKVQCIGFANKPGKRTRLVDAGADAVIGTMADLAGALRASSCPV